MGAGVNVATFIGHLGRDPELRHTQSGSAVCNMRLAVGSRVKVGEAWKDHTEWITLVAFGKTAENAAQYLGKGRQVYARCRFTERAWQDKDGHERKSAEFVVDDLQYLGGTEQRAAGAGDRRTSSDRAGESSKAPDGEPGAPGGFVDDDLPF
jgi:single-strand DNA-binding protein